MVVEKRDTDSGPANFRFSVDAKLKERWVQTCAERKISQQDAITSLMEFVLNQDEVAQLMLFNQARPRPDLIEVVLRRLAEKAKSGRTGVSYHFPETGDPVRIERKST